MNKIENDNIYKWDLSKILEGDTFDNLLKKYYKGQEELVALYKNNPFTEKNKLKEFHNKQLEFKILSNRVSNYISNNINSDLSENKWFLLSQEISTKSIPFVQAFSTYEDDVLKHKENILSFLKEDSDISKHERSYEEIFKFSKHKLTSEIKKFCATYSPLSSSYYETFTLLFDKELQVKKALDSSKKAHVINNYSDYLRLLQDKDRKLRKNTYINWNNAVHNHRDSFARLMYYNFLELNVEAKNHNFPGGYFEASMFEDELPLDFVPLIYKSVAKWANIIKKYKTIYKKILKINHSLKSVKPWDLQLSFYKDTEEYSIDEAQKLVLKALMPLGSDYQKRLKEAFSEGWIDWLPRKNKLSGAYCIGGCYGLKNKYIMLNYNHKFDDVSTLAHELGHAMHATYFCEKQDIYASCSIFTAEIPSILNEVLLNLHFLEEYKKQNNHKKVLEIYDNLISGFINTTSSQITFSEWEYEISSMILNNQAITADIAEQIYQEKIKKYFGKRKSKLTEIEKKSLTKILTVPHFYAGNFYVYKYAIGKVVAVILAYDLINQQTSKKTLEKLYDFLSSGCSKSNLDTIELLGFSLKNSEIWEKAKKILISWIDEYEKLFKEIY